MKNTTLFVSALFLMHFPHLYSADWANTTLGNWQENGNWENTATFPSGVDAVANISAPFSILGTKITILPTPPVTVGTLSIQVDPASSLAIDGASFAMATSSGTPTITYTSGSIASSINAPIVINQGVIVNCTEPNSTFRFSGAVSGSGALTKTGPGLFQLTDYAGFSYSGGTVINDGVLQGSTFSLQGNITTNATLLIQQNSSGTYAGNIDGTGAVVKTGSGMVTFSGAHTYTGGTVVSAGTLQGTTANIQGSVANNSSVIFNQAADGTYSGNMTGTGSLIKLGAGTVVMTGANSYTGGTSVLTGALQGNSTSLQGNIVNNTLVIFDQAEEGTYAGSLSGLGSLSKQSAGQLSLTGDHTLAGTTTVSEGRLSVNGTLASAGGVSVEPPAILAGTGTIIANVLAEGTVAPGNSIGTLNLVGDQTLASTSILEIEYNPTANDLLNVIGGLSIQPGATLSLIPGLGTYPEELRFPIVKTTSGTIGTFSDVFSYPLLSPQLIYSANDVEIELLIQLLPFSEVISEGNAGAVAVCLDAADASSRTEFNDVIDALRLIPSLSGLKEALNELQPSILKGLALTQENNMFNVRKILSERAEKKYLGCCRPKKQEPKPQEMTQEGEMPPEQPDMAERALGFWFDVFGDATNQLNQHGHKGYHAATGAAVLGFDYAICEQFYLGISGAYTYSAIDWKSSVADGHIQSYYGSLYALWTMPHFFMDAALIGAYSDYDAKRKIKFSYIDRSARSSHGGGEGLVHLGAGAPFKLCTIDINPFAYADYMFMHETGFKESGAQALDLSVTDKSSTLLRWEAGLSFERCFTTKFGQYAPFLKISAVEELRFQGGHYRAKFEDANCHFTVKGLNPDRMMVSPGVGLNMFFCERRMAFSLRYDGEFSDNFWDQMIDFQMLFKF